MGIITDIGMKFITKLGINITSNNNTIVEVDNSEDKSRKPKIRGKALTRNQMKILVENGVSSEDVELYLLHKTSFAQEGAEKRLNQSCNKVAKWTLVHRDTGELLEVYIVRK